MWISQTVATNAHGHAGCAYGDVVGTNEKDFCVFSFGREAETYAGRDADSQPGDCEPLAEVGLFMSFLHIKGLDHPQTRTALHRP